MLADTGFSSVEFVNGVEKLRDFQAIVGIPKNRLMANGRAIKTITKKGQLVQIQRFKKMVTASWVYLSLQQSHLPDWQTAASLTLQQLLPNIAVSLLLIEVERNRKLLAAQGLALELVSIQI